MKAPAFQLPLTSSRRFSHFSSKTPLSSHVSPFSSHFAGFSQRPPPRSPSSPSSSPVVAWLTTSQHHNSLILSTAYLSFRPVVPIANSCARTVARAAVSSHATTVYLHPHYATAQDISILRAHSLFVVCVISRPTSDVVPPLLVASVAAPLLLEKKGDTLTKFFRDPNNDNLLLEQNGVDDRPVLERFIAWLTRVYLPTGFPHTTTPDYISFTKYRTIQNLASAIMQVIR